MNILLRQHQCPGDILMLTAAVRDLKRSHPYIGINVETTAMALWENNPHLDRSINAMNADRVIDLHYPLIHSSDRLPYHFVHAFRIELEYLLGLRIQQGAFRGEVFLTEDEKKPLPAVSGLTGGYWIIDAGHKQDFPLKYWGVYNWQELADRLAGKVTLIQIGARDGGHFHPAIKGAMDLRGATTHREFCRLMYHAAGVITPVSYPMHLAAAVPTPDGRLRPCIVINGGREPVQWVQYPGHQFFHTVGALDCCRKGGCWKSKSDQCKHPVTVGGCTIGKCMTMISPERVAEAVLQYHNNR